MNRTNLTRAIALAAAAVIVTACEAEKSSNPLSPSIAGPIPGVEITAPQLLEPAQNFKFRESQQPVRLVIGNARTNGVRPLSYTFEVATDSAFTTKVFARSSVPPGGDGRTSVQVDRLEVGRSYFWRARAEDGANSGPFLAAAFEVLPKGVMAPPAALSPANNEQTPTATPTLRLRNSDRNAGVGAVTYEFQLGLNQAFTQLVIDIGVPEAPGETTYTVPNALAGSTTYYWRARGSDGETVSDWSTTQVFRTPGAPAPGPGPSPNPNPPSGGSCALGNGPAIINCISAKYADRRRPVGSLAERQANMIFLRDRVIEAGKCSGLEYGYNMKRGGPEYSIDVIAWKRNDGNMGVDIAFDYDNYGTTLQLAWAEIDLFAVFGPYPSVSCGGV